MEMKKQAIPGSVNAVTVVDVHHWTNRLFSFRVTRPDSFRFRSGEFVMIGLMKDDGKPLLRAYSIASPSWDHELDFFSIKVEDGPLTSRLQKIQVGDEILLGKKPTGTLVLDALLPGKTLYLLSTGTGIAPFASVIRDPETYDRFDHVVLTHTCRDVAELAYGEKIVKDTLEDPLVGEMVQGRLTHYTSTTREAHTHTGRITTLIENGKLFEDLGRKPFNKDEDRVMICGSMGMLQDTKDLCEAAGLTEGANSMPGEFVIEKAFVG
ncbi:MAG: ferredoxin--NADP reductase [Pseudomonadota bacterium]|nr:ferredoxin--NADP reductase [Pseudomonadota bacterium]